MAARKRKVALSDDWKENIRASNLMTRLYGHAIGDVEMSKTQIDATKIILAKILPDLKASDITMNANVTVMTDEERRARLKELMAKL